MDGPSNRAPAPLDNNDDDRESAMLPCIVPTVFDFAARIRSRLGQVDPYRLNKLAYYIQAWSLVHRDRPAFQERIEAWKDGPVVRDLWIDLKHNSGGLLRSAQPLSNEDAEIVDQVLIHYGRMTATELIDLTHAEDPWLQARGSTPPGAPSQNEVSSSSMRAYYTRVWDEAQQDNEAAIGEPAFRGSIEDLERYLAG